MKNCKIARDLFPSHIDGLTNKETNQYIEEHLKECEDCRKVLESMQKELKSNISTKDSKEVKYIKKFSDRMKILKIILIMIVLIFMISVGRKMVIIANLNNKTSNYTSSTNYYIKSFNYSADDFMILEVYKKDEKYVRKYKFFSEDVSGGPTISTDYFNGKTVNTYMEVAKRVAILNKSDNILKPIIPNKLEIYNNNPFHFILISIFSSITSEECNGKDCYRIVNFGGAILYIEKETGLLIRTIGEGKASDGKGWVVDTITDFQYEFNVVTEEHFIEPDISEYEMQE